MKPGALRPATDITIFARLLEAEATSEDGHSFGLVLDGVERGSFLSSPATFAAAANSQWEPETWIISLHQASLQRWPDLQAGMQEWLEIHFSVGVAGAGDGHVFFAASANRPDPVPVSLSMVSRVRDDAIVAKLEGFSTLTGVDAADEADIRDILEQATEGIEQRLLLVFDVGQGNWNALADAGACPSSPPTIRLFYDCGVATGMHRDSMPAQQLDPFIGVDPDVPVILSHWDMDHWAGAALGQPLFGNKGIKINWHPAAVSRKWIVPLQGKAASGQRISSTAWRLALALHRKGNLVIWPAGLLNIALSSGDWVVRCVPVASRADNNNSGLAFLARTPRLNGTLAYSLALGDAAYSSMLPQCPPLNRGGAVLTGLVASHHGGALICTPPRAIPGWAKLAFSHGDKYGHPTSDSKDDHREQGWGHQYETHARKKARLSNGVVHEVGTVALGGLKVASDAATGLCMNCAARGAICPAH